MSSGLSVGLKLHSQNIAILKCLQKEVLDLTLEGCVGGLLRNENLFSGLSKSEFGTQIPPLQTDQEHRQG